MDSLDSTDPLYSDWATNPTFGAYDPAKRKAKADGIVVAGDMILDVPNGVQVYGSVDTGPGGVTNIQQNGSVGDLTWAQPGISTGPFPGRPECDLALRAIARNQLLYPGHQSLKQPLYINTSGYYQVPGQLRPAKQRDGGYECECGSLPHPRARLQRRVGRERRRRRTRIRQPPVEGEHQQHADDLCRRKIHHGWNQLSRPNHQRRQPGPLRSDQPRHHCFGRQHQLYRLHLRAPGQSLHRRRRQPQALYFCRFLIAGSITHYGPVHFIYDENLVEPVPGARLWRQTGRNYNPPAPAT